MTDPIPIGTAPGIGSYLGQINFFRRPDGSIHANLIDMPPHVIESEATICDRFFLASKWCLDGTLDLMRQGLRFDEETRQSKEEITP
jgi:hypothetical protein